MRAHGLDEGLADDIRQELFFHLQERSAYRLRSFRGTTEAQFRVFLRRVAMRFTHRCLTRWWRNQWREDHAVRLLARQGRRGPTESELLGFLQELEALMTDCDRARLRMVLRWAGLTDPDRPIAGRCDEYSDRTYRRWSADLYLRYARRVI